LDFQLYLLYLLFLIESQKKESLFPHFFLVLAIVNLIYQNRSYESGKEQAIKRFVGLYKLHKLDGENCENCKLNIHSNYNFDIIMGNEIIGTGKWHLDIDYEEVGLYLVIEGGPSGVASIDEIKREIEFLNQQKK
jgi:hypothetical protein